MKKYQVEIRENYNSRWDAGVVEDYVEAESPYEAFDLARDYLKEQVAQYSNESPDIVENWQFLVKEVNENGDSISESVFNGNDKEYNLDEIEDKLHNLLVEYINIQNKAINGEITREAVNRELEKLVDAMAYFEDAKSKIIANKDVNAVVLSDYEIVRPPEPPAGAEVDAASVTELIELLRNNNQNAAVNLSNFLTSMDVLKGEISAVKNELSEVKKLLAEKLLAEKEATGISNNLFSSIEKKCTAVQSQITALKNKVEKQAKDIVDEFKKYGKLSMEKVSNLLGVGRRLHNISSEISEVRADIAGKVKKIDNLNSRIQTSKQMMKNAGKALLGKEIKEADISLQNKKGVLSVAKSSLVLMDDLFRSMQGSIELLRDKVELVEGAEYKEISKSDLKELLNSDIDFDFAKMHHNSDNFIIKYDKIDSKNVQQALDNSVKNTMKRQ